MRTAALQAEVARNQRLAFAVLLDVLLPMLIGDSVSAHAIQLRSGPAIQEPTPVFDYNTREMACPFEGVANLIASVPEDEAERFAWVLALDDESVARTLAACTGALIDATQGKYADRERLRCVDRIARAANLDMREHWEAGVEFFGAISKKAMLAALTEASGSRRRRTAPNWASRTWPSPAPNASPVAGGCPCPSHSRRARAGGPVRCG
jgi:ParB family chromosome partitioning protein